MIAAEQDKRCSDSSWPLWRSAISSFCAVALILSVYLSWRHLTGVEAIGCGAGSTCEQVLSSRWSTVGGLVPVSGLAMGLYSVMLVASFYAGPATPEQERRLAWSVMLTLVGAIAGSALWFVTLQAWVIGTYCPFCMATHVVGLLVAVLVIGQARRQLQGAPAGTNLPPRWLGKPVVFPLLGLALAGGLAATQAFQTLPGVVVAGETADGDANTEELLPPLIGRPDAPVIVTLLFDYQCRHCQQMHFILNEAVQRLEGELAIALRPAPLSTQCNSFVPRDVEQFEGSCELAKISLAVWLADEQAHAEFHQWMFTFDTGARWQPRSLSTAHEKAIALVGEAAMESALGDPWIQRCLDSSVQRYGAAGGGPIPKLVYGSRWVTASPTDADALLAVLREQLSAPLP
ncbi:hypothetical protein NG895_09005 [Aeoliella sp. ICT_H6.2]|uniref:Vitamin K epoxide reductase domain-containing protein n=1 Tax=Aeoliella straminimaris TaxID=2954799 RepID=A0A9X2FDV5_9BACT|nr:hypothetical protein [Aeoliella straminimaris]